MLFQGRVMSPVWTRATVRRAERTGRSAQGSGRGAARRRQRLPHTDPALSELWGTMGGMPSTPDPTGTTTIDRAALRSRADELLTALAGPGAKLREDQWTAIEAL